MSFYFIILFIIADYMNFGKCLDPNDVTAAVDCLKAVTLTTGDNQLCDMSKEYRKCGDKAMMNCEKKEFGLNSTIQGVMDLVMLPCPGDVNLADQCSLLELGSTLAMCWFPTVSLMVPWDKFNETYNPIPYIQATCSSDQLQRSLECHEKAITTCDFQMIETWVIRRLVDTICADDFFQTRVASPLNILAASLLLPLEILAASLLLILIHLKN